jgi:hypothetical protein
MNMIERDWLDVASRDGECVNAAWLGLPELNRQEAINALEVAIVLLAEGEDVSPGMRKQIARLLRTRRLKLVPCRGQRGGKRDRHRDATIAALFDITLHQVGGKREAAYAEAARMLGQTPRSIKQAIQRHRREIESD